MEASDRLIDIIEDRLALSTILGMALETAETGSVPPESCMPTLHDELDNEIAMNLIMKISELKTRRG